jgi:hypothetical protein
MAVRDDEWYEKKRWSMANEIEEESKKYSIYNFSKH